MHFVVFYRLFTLELYVWGVLSTDKKIIRISCTLLHFNVNLMPFSGKGRGIITWTFTAPFMYFCLFYRQFTIVCVRKDSEMSRREIFYNSSCDLVNCIGNFAHLSFFKDNFLIGIVNPRTYIWSCLDPAMPATVHLFPTAVPAPPVPALSNVANLLLFDYVSGSGRCVLTQVANTIVWLHLI